jgi:hypothetical protein
MKVVMGHLFKFVQQSGRNFRRQKNVIVQSRTASPRSLNVLPTPL